MNIPDEAVDAARDTIYAAAEYVTNETLQDALAAAAPLLVAAELEAISADYPSDVFLPESVSRDGVAGTAIREVLAGRAAWLRHEPQE